MPRLGIDTLFENPGRPTGATGFLKILIRGLAELDRRNEYVLFVSRANRDSFEPLVGPNWQLVELPYSNENLPARIATQQTLVPWLVRRHHLDVLNSPGNTAPILLPCKSVLTIKTLHHLDRGTQIGRARTIYRRIMVRESARRAALVIANSQDTARRIEERLGVPSAKIRVVYEAVHDAFQPAPDIASVRRSVSGRYGLRGDYVLFVSTLWRYKNADGLIRAFRKVSQKFPDTELAIVGRDHAGYLDEVRQLTTSLGLDGQVKFIGPVQNQSLPELYQAAKVFVYPSFEETFGLTLVEAMRCGVPVIASDVTSIPEVLGGAGVLIDPHDDDEIAGAMMAVLGNPPHGAELKEKGLLRGREFSAESMARGTLSALEEVAGVGRSERI